MSSFTFSQLGRVWLVNAKTSIIREIAFRGNFILGVARQFFWTATFIFIVHIIFQNTQSLHGWGQAQMLMIIALSRTIEGIMDLLTSRNIAMLPQVVQKGEFDFFLLKPLPAQFAVAFQKFHIYNIGNVMAGFTLFIYALFQLDHLPSLSAWVVFIPLVAISFIVFYSFLILIASLVFRFERLEALYGFMALFTEPFTVPFDIFPRVPRLAMTYLIPIAFVIFVPAQAITGKLAIWELPVAILVCAIFWYIANQAWRSGLKRYTSASS